MSNKWIELYRGLMEGVIPFGSGGYIINVRFSDQSDYTIFETIGFDNVKNIHQMGRSVTFQSDGHKIYILFEPVSFIRRHVEPYLREPDELIPLRWNELHKVDTPRKNNIYISREPYVSNGSFTVEIPEQGSFVYFIYDGPERDRNAVEFIKKILSDDFKVPRASMDQVLNHYVDNLILFNQASSEA